MKKRAITAEEISEISSFNALYRFYTHWCLSEGIVLFTKDEYSPLPNSFNYSFYSSAEEALISNAITTPDKRVLSMDVKPGSPNSGDNRLFFNEFAYPYRINVFTHEVELFEVTS